MKLFLLKRIDDSGWDVNNGFVVREENENAARSRCSLERGDEGGGTWLSSEYSTCEEISPEGDPEILLTDFHAG